MDLPPLPPVVEGRSALAAFVPLTAWVAQAAGGEAQAAEAALARAREEAAARLAGAQDRLEQTVLAAQAEAEREAEDRARDMVSAARLAVERWIRSVEPAMAPVVDEALLRLTGP